MTTDDLIAEGDSFLQAHPTAKASRVREHLEHVAAGYPDRPRDALEASAFGALDVVPLVRKWWHRGRIDRAMRELFPGEKVPKRKGGFR